MRDAERNDEVRIMVFYEAESARVMVDIGRTSASREGAPVFEAAVYDFFHISGNVARHFAF